MPWEAYSIVCALCVMFLTCPGKSIREESLLILVSSEGVVSNLSAIFARLSFASTYRSEITNQQGCQLKCQGLGLTVCTVA